MSDSVTPWTPAHQASLSVTISRSLLRLMSIESVMPSNHLILCHPLLLLPYVFPSIRVFSNELTLPIRWPKYWSFSFSNSPSNKKSGLISFRIDWFDLLAVQGILKSLLQHRSSKGSILQHQSCFSSSNQFFESFLVMLHINVNIQGLCFTKAECVISGHTSILHPPGHFSLLLLVVLYLSTVQ